MHLIPVGRDISVGIATCYGLDGPGIECRCERDFPHPSRLALGVHPASCTMGTGSFPGTKWLGPGVVHPTPSAEIKERVELYLYSPYWYSWACYRVKFAFYTIKKLLKYVYESNIRQGYGLYILKKYDLLVYVLKMVTYVS